METLLKLSRNGELILPSELRQFLGVKDGEYLRVKVIGHSLVITPQKVFDEDQIYFWSKEWQAAEREAQADIENGRVATFESVDALLIDLNT